MFGGLETLEAKHEAHERVHSRSGRRDDQSLWKPDPVTEDRLSASRHPPRRDARDRDGFVRPAPRQSPRHHFQSKRPRLTPDHQKHPERWTRYDLGDVSSQDLSERSNAAAALSFLNNRSKQDAPSTNTSVDETSGSSTAMMTDDSWGVKPGPSSTKQSGKASSSTSQDKGGELEEPFKMKHSFRKPKASTENTETVEKDDEDKAKFVRGKYVMPEYQIGKAPETKINKKGSSSKTSKQPELETRDLKLFAEDSEVPDVAVPTMATEVDTDVAMETQTISETKFKSRKKLNKRGMRQKQCTDSDEDSDIG